MDRIIDSIFNFQGRANRGEFLTFALFLFLAWLCLGVVTGMTQLGLVVASGNASGSVAYRLWNSAISLLPAVGIAVSVRRLHDSGRSGLWVLLAVPTFISWQLTNGLARVTTSNGQGPIVEELLSTLTALGYITGALLLVFLLLPGNDLPNRYDHGGGSTGPKRVRLTDPDAPPHKPVFDFGPTAHDANREDQRASGGKHHRQD